MNNWWIKLHRQIEQSELYLSTKFDKARAWIDLLLLANHKDHTFFIRWNEINVKRWQVAWAMQSLAQRWKWDRWTVKRFFSWLELRWQINTICNNRITTIIAIKNYELYQDTTTEPTTDTTTETQQKPHKQEWKELKNEKNIISKEILQTPKEIAKEFFDLWIDSDIWKQTIEKYPHFEEELKKFWSYWTEPTPNGKKQLWQTKPTFEIKRRLATWFSNKRNKPSFLDEKEHLIIP